MKKPRKQKLVWLSFPSELGLPPFRIGILTPKRGKHWVAVVQYGGLRERVSTRVVCRSSRRQFVRLAYRQFCLHPQALDALFDPANSND